tara:strand:+ start:1019 stop:1609 length:591 start_codon:yes stop_codon:yes gene_type:complete
LPYSSLAIIKSYLGIPSGSSSEDTAVTAALNAADAEIDNICGRTFTVPGATSIKTYVPTSDKYAIVEDVAQLSGLVVKVDTTDDGTYDTTLAATSYIMDGNSAPFTVLRRVDGNSFYRFHSNRPTIQVTAYHGYQMGNVPYPIVQASTILAARLYQRRSSPLGVTAGTAEAGVFRISRQDPELGSLLRGFRLFGVA